MTMTHTPWSNEAGEVSWRGGTGPQASDGSNESYNPPYAHPPRILGPYAQTSSSQSPRESFLELAAGSKAQSRQVGVLQPRAWLVRQFQK